MSKRLIAPVFALLVLAAPFLGLPGYWVSLLDYIGIASLVTLGLVLLTGVGGMTSFGQAAFVGFGAYTSAVLTTSLGWSPWLTLPAALVVTGVGALLIGAVTVRLSGHYVPLGTIAWGISFFFLFGNTSWLGAHDGLSGIPPVSIGKGLASSFDLLSPTPNAIGRMRSNRTASGRTTKSRNLFRDSPRYFRSRGIDRSRRAEQAATHAGRRPPRVRVVPRSNDEAGRFVSAVVTSQQ